ncbi:hypothetical protein D9613_003472 [Agrocybe pediades]|uniref:G domain-containing protein n=1 Tax=Agrocybe pediades TaxID=84607 RepID=A0A8H4QQ29_9AGAR|nr:hypothetical protein D9613_003472 [Agrocybe pediades]
MSATNPNKQEIVIIVIGLTGAGKSFFVNAATNGQNAGAVSHRLTSSRAPSRLIPLPQDVDGNIVQVVDTQGFDDTNPNTADAVTWRNITNQLTRIRAENRQRLFGAIYLTSFPNNRVQEADKKNLKTFLLLYGVNVPRTVVLVSNRATREQHDELVQLDPWKSTIKDGGQDARFCGDRGSALTIVEKAVRRIIEDKRGIEINEKLITKNLKKLGLSEQEESEKRRSLWKRFLSWFRPS